jgi:predicted ATPase
MKNIGLCGSHRTGKTTLAMALAARSGKSVLKTQTSAVFAAQGLDPAQVMNFKTRLWIQGLILEDAQNLWKNQSHSFIADRTPLDMLAYTLADIQGATEVDYVALQAYSARCFALSNQFFPHIVILPPAIPLVHETGKAALNPAYIEHLHTVMLGLAHEENLKSKLLLMPRAVMNLDARVAQVLQNFSE